MVSLPVSFAAFKLYDEKDWNTSVVVAFYLAIFLCFTVMVEYIALGSSSFKLRATLLRWWSKDITWNVGTCCPKRKARFFKCAKRSARRKSQSEDGPSEKEGTDWRCPFECAFARIHMPAPLPFRRKKRFVLNKIRPEVSQADDQPQVPGDSTEKTKEELAIKVRTDGVEPSIGLPDLSSSTDESLTASDPEGSNLLSRKSKRRHDRRKRRGLVPSGEGIATLLTFSSLPPLPVSPTTLIDLAMMQDWAQLLVNVKAYRRQARQRDADGLFPLHWAVSGGPPVDVVRALIKAYPGATKKVDSDGSNALHFASHYGGSLVIMELLLEANPKAISVQDNHGRSPLYHAVDKAANIDVLAMLATADPTMITTACRPMNYLQLEKEGKRWDYLSPLYLAWVNFLMDKRSIDTCAGKLWGKACLLLDLVYRHSFNLAETVQVPVVVAVIVLDAALPEELAEVVIRGVPSTEFLEVDPFTGKIPLALAASMKQLAAQRSNDLIRLLLEACPSAAKVLDPEGKTPLANAAATGKSWDSGLGRLVEAFPDALGWSDHITRLTPSLLLAASSPQKTEIKRSRVMLADPYSLMGVKALSLRRRSLEQMRQRSKIDSFPLSATSEGENDSQHLSSIFKLMKQDPSWIVTSIIRG